MYSEKIQIDTHPDLTLYIEGLLNIPEVPLVEEQQVEEKNIIDVKDSQNTQQIDSQSEIADIPDWADQTFECLLVKLAGMNVIVPAMSVSYIEKIDKKITHIPSETDAFKGVVTLRDKSIAVIDLYSLITESGLSNIQQNMTVDENYIDHVIVMDNGNYALACDDVSHMLTLDAEDVRWNTSTFNNPMFSGVVTEQLCPIVNIEKLNELVTNMPFVQKLIERNS